MRSSPKKLFSDLNSELLGPPGDDNIIILNDSDEEEEVHAEEAIDAKVVPPSTKDSPAPTVSAIDTDASEGLPNDSNNGHTLDQAQGDSNDGGDEASSP
jgi:hypothetical protein